MQSEDKIIVGKIGKARGLDGTLKIIPLTDFEGRFDNLTEIEVGGKMLQVEKVQHIGNEIFIKFENITSREIAKTLTNKFLTVPRAEAAPLDEGEFYIFDIIGCEVFDGDKNIGKVENVLKTGSNDVFQVVGETEFLIPALKSVIKQIDIANKKIIVDSSKLEEI